METEAELVDIIKDYFQKDKLLVEKEVKMLSKKIDLVCIDPRTNCVLAIEAKLEKWQRAIQQAATYRLCSDYSYIAMPSENTRNVNMELLKKYGIGLISVDGDKLDIICEAEQSKVMHQKM